MYVRKSKKNSADPERNLNVNNAIEKKKWKMNITNMEKKIERGTVLIYGNEINTYMWRCLCSWLRQFLE
jgi:hypothetical protein